MQYLLKEECQWKEREREDGEDKAFFEIISNNSKILGIWPRNSLYQRQQNLLMCLVLSSIETNWEWVHSEEKHWNFELMRKFLYVFEVVLPETSLLTISETFRFLSHEEKMKSSCSSGIFQIDQFSHAPLHRPTFSSHEKLAKHSALRTCAAICRHPWRAASAHPKKTIYTRVLKP